MTIYKEVSITDFYILMTHYLCVSCQERTLKKTLILSGHDFLANWKRYSYAPLWVNSYLDLTMDFPTCHCRWPFRKRAGNVFWMIVFSLWPSKLRCPPMRTVLLKKRYRSQKPLWSAQMLSNIWKLWFFVISNKNVGD